MSGYDADASSLLSPAALNRNRAAALAAAFATMLVVGCQSGGGPTPDSVRNTGQTAPADLQLTCASAAATPLGVDGATVLPVSSSQIDAQTFQVMLQSGSAQASCVIDASGNVISVQRV
jgi:hypothetical protein